MQPEDIHKLLERQRIRDANIYRKHRHNPSAGYIMLFYLALCAIMVAMLHQGARDNIPFLAPLILLLRKPLSNGIKYALSAIAPSAEKVITRDKRRPALYLRSFNVDGAKIHADRQASFANIIFWLNPEQTYEQILKKAIKKVAPLIAIGDPIDEVTQDGAARMYIDDDWQRDFLILLDYSQAVFINIGDSDGLLWEISQVSKIDRPEKVVLCLPLYTSTEREKQSKYDVFRSKSYNFFPKPLPKSVNGASFIYFDNAWTPSLLIPLLGEKYSGIASDIHDPIQRNMQEILKAIHYKFQCCAS